MRDKMKNECRKLREIVLNIVQMIFDIKWVFVNLYQFNLYTTSCILISSWLACKIGTHVLSTYSNAEKIKIGPIISSHYHIFLKKIK